MLLFVPQLRSEFYEICYRRPTLNLWNGLTIADMCQYLTVADMCNVQHTKYLTVADMCHVQYSTLRT